MVADALATPKANQAAPYFRDEESSWKRPSSFGPYAALDLGTNNCRLLVAKPAPQGFRVVDAFSRIVRLGEGLSQTGRLGENAIARTLDALKVCRDKLDLRNVKRARLIATEACRAAANGQEFLDRVERDIGLRLEVIDRETEARLAVAGCDGLADEQARSILLFDIGGGSSEVIWLSGGSSQRDGLPARIRAWESLRLGVVSLAEKFGGENVEADDFERMVDYVSEEMAPFERRVAGEIRCDRFHLLGTSGTVTTIAGVHLNLARYDRRAVDGLWLDRNQIDAAIARLRRMSYAERVANGCIGAERADLVLAGCAILEAIRRSFPAERVRIADRGLREGILAQMMAADGHIAHNQVRS